MAKPYLFFSSSPNILYPMIVFTRNPVVEQRYVQRALIAVLEMWFMDYLI